MVDTTDYVNPKKPGDFVKDRCRDVAGCNIFIFADKVIINCGEDRICNS